MGLMLRRRPLTALAIAFLAVTALLTAGCGVEGKDDAGVAATPTDGSTTDDSTTDDTTDDTVDDTTDDTTDDTVDDTTDDTIDDDFPTDTTFDDDLPTDEDVRQQVVDLYLGMGLDEDQAGCLADKIIDSGLTDSSDVDPTEAMDWFGDCDISVSDLDMGG